MNEGIIKKIKNKTSEKHLKKIIQNTVGNLGEYTIDENGNIIYILDSKKIIEKYEKEDEINIILPSIININLNIKKKMKTIPGFESIKYVLKHGKFNKPINLETISSELSLFHCYFLNKTTLKSIDSKLNLFSCTFNKNVDIINTKKLNININEGYYLICYDNLNIESNEINIGTASVNLMGNTNDITTNKLRIGGIIRCSKKININVSELELISVSSKYKYNINSPIIIYNGKQILKNKKEENLVNEQVCDISIPEQANNNKFVKVLK